MICKKSIFLIDFIYSNLKWNPLECSCDLADALRNPNGTTVSIMGTCEDKQEHTTEQLSSFLNKTKLGEYGVFFTS